MGKTAVEEKLNSNLKHSFMEEWNSPGVLEEYGNYTAKQNIQ